MGLARRGKRILKLFLCGNIHVPKLLLYAMPWLYEQDEA